jgi:hypothetical protein
MMVNLKSFSDLIVHITVSFAKLIKASPVPGTLCFYSSLWAAYNGSRNAHFYDLLPRHCIFVHQEQL